MPETTWQLESSCGIICWQNFYAQNTSYKQFKKQLRCFYCIVMTETVTSLIP